MPIPDITLNGELSGAPEAIQLAVFGPAQDKLIAIADRLTEEIAKVPGTNETTLQRAIKAKHPSAPGGPLQWVMDVQKLQLSGAHTSVDVHGSFGLVAGRFPLAGAPVATSRST